MTLTAHMDDAMSWFTRLPEYAKTAIVLGGAMSIGAAANAAITGWIGQPKANAAQIAEHMELPAHSGADQRITSLERAIQVNVCVSRELIRTLQSDATGADVDRCFFDDELRNLYVR